MWPCLVVLFYPMILVLFSVKHVSLRVHRLNHKIASNDTKDISIYLLTYNLNQHFVDKSKLSKLFDFDNHQFGVHDIYAVTFQEMPNDTRAYMHAMKNTFRVYGYEQVRKHSKLHKTSLNVYVRREIMKEVINIRNYTIELDSKMRRQIKTQIGRMRKSGRGMLDVVFKSACVISLQWRGVSMVFVGAHLAADEPFQKSGKGRIENYHLVMKRLRAKDSFNSDCIFFMGDLNFRLNKLDRNHNKHLSMVYNAIESKDWNALLKHDQLKMCQQDKVAFMGFTEGEVNFAPTYKYKIAADSSQYDRKRVPAYTDRILHRSKLREVETKCYSSMDGFTTSDHKPVRAVVSIH